MPRPISLLILNALNKGFQMSDHLFQKYFEKMVKIKETFFLSTSGVLIKCRHCIVEQKCNGHLAYINGGSVTPFVYWTSPKLHSIHEWSLCLTTLFDDYGSGAGFLKGVMNLLKYLLM